MQSLFVCEDDPRQREILERIVRNYIMIENLDIALVLSTDNPLTILDFLNTSLNAPGIYILDVDLHHELNGISLASKIRQMDPMGKIIFVTTHGELSYLTFMYKVEALDYILKDQPEHLQNRVQECIQIAHQRYLEEDTPKKSFKITTGDWVRMIPFDDIMFFESAATPHKLTLHMLHGQLEFYDSIKQVAELGFPFIRCHKSFVVNILNITEVDKGTKTISMVNGESCPMSVRAMKGVLEKLHEVDS